MVMLNQHYLCLLCTYKYTRCLLVKVSKCRTESRIILPLKSILQKHKDQSRTKNSLIQLKQITVVGKETRLVPLRKNNKPNKCIGQRMVI